MGLPLLSQHLRPKLTLMPQPTIVVISTVDMDMVVMAIDFMDSVDIPVITMVDTMVTDGVDTTDVTSTRGLLMLSPRPKLKLMLMPLTTIVKTTDILNDFTKDLSDLLLGIMDSESKTKLTNTPLTETSTEATETPTETSTEMTETCTETTETCTETTETCTEMTETCTETTETCLETTETCMEMTETCSEMTETSTETTGTSTETTGTS